MTDSEYLKAYIKNMDIGDGGELYIDFVKDGICLITMSVSEGYSKFIEEKLGLNDVREKLFFRKFLKADDFCFF
jgi:hypothetical protein